MDLTLDTTRSAAYRAWLTQSFMRGIAHELANVVQMLALEPPPSGALATARDRLTAAMEAIAAIADGQDPAAGPSVLPDVLHEVSLWHGLQTGLPAATLEITPATGLPALGCGHAAARGALLALIASAKQGGARRLTLTPAHDAVQVRCELAHDGAETPSPEAQGYIADCGATLRIDSSTHWELRFAAAAGVTGSA